MLTSVFTVLRKTSIFFSLTSAVDACDSDLTPWWSHTSLSVLHRWSHSHVVSSNLIFISSLLDSHTTNLKETTWSWVEWRLPELPGLVCVISAPRQLQQPQCVARWVLKGTELLVDRTETASAQICNEMSDLSKNIFLDLATYTA